MVSHAEISPESEAAPVISCPVPVAHRRIALLLVLVWFSSLPDAMVPPVLRELFVVRYGTTASVAYWFMGINLIGAVSAVPLLALVRRRLGDGVVLAAVAAVNAVLLAAMMMPIGPGWTLTLRFFEGGADLVVFATLFHLVGLGVATRRARRLGLAGTVLMLGLAGGAMLGGVVGDARPELVFLVGAACCFIVMAAAPLTMAGRHTPAETTPLARDAGQRLWPVLVMAFGDRAVAGILATTVPMFIAAAAGASPRVVGALLALPLFLMAFGAWPAGLLADRFGAMRVRLAAAVVYASALVGVACTGSTGFIAAIPLAVLGVAGAALLPTTLALAAATGTGAMAMGACQAAGSAGFFTAIVGSAGILAVFGERPSAYVAVIIAAAVVHAALTVITLIAMRRADPTSTATT